MFVAIINGVEALTHYKVVGSREERDLPPGTKIVEIPDKVYAATGEEFIAAIREAQGND